MIQNQRCKHLIKLLFIYFCAVFSPTLADNKTLTANVGEDINKPTAVELSQRFVSLTLCSDRLLMALAAPEQIAAMSPYSNNPLMMLDKVNTDKPTVKPQLSHLLPYADATVLINELFYPRLLKRLKALNFRLIAINDSPQNAKELYQLIQQLGKVTGNENTASNLINQLKNQNTRLHYPTLAASTVILSETGVADLSLPQYQVLLDLLGLQATSIPLSKHDFSLETLLLSNPSVIIALADKHGYHDQGKLLSHPLLRHLKAAQPSAEIPLKYTYCFDHGVWQGAKKLYQQLAPDF